MVYDSRRGELLAFVRRIEAVTAGRDDPDVAVREAVATIGAAGTAGR